MDEAEGALETSANIEIPGSVVQPGLEFVVEVDPASQLDPGLGVARRIPETGRAGVRVEPVPTFDLTVIPFVWAGGSDLSIVDIAEGMAADPQGHEMLWPTRTLLPVGHLDVKAHEPILTSTTDVFTLYRETALAWAMGDLMGTYMGIMPEYVIGGQSGLGSIGGPYNFSVADPFVVSHEIGHNLSLLHAPCGGAGASAGASASTPVSAGPPTRTLLLWGGADARGEPFLEPAFVLDAPPSVPPSAGEYELTGPRGDRGRVVLVELRHAGKRWTAMASPPSSSRCPRRPSGPASWRASRRLRGVLRGPSSGDPMRAAASAGLAAAGADLEVLVSRGIPAQPPRER